ncbi:uncharacterized protein, partial [Chelonus insularis]|uniref:uncharacterized protein n=1 Tax=Chelonus insularis TaxID=460826 RepID=UPI001588EF33
MRTSMRTEQWLSPKITDKEEKRTTGLGAGALYFIRNRGSMRRQLTRDSSNQTKRSEEYTSTSSSSIIDTMGGSSKFGKWLREHLKGSKSCSHDIDNSLDILKSRAGLSESYSSTLSESEKVLSRTICTSQNVYCSLPREHRRYSHDTGKTNESSRERLRSGSCRLREKVFSSGDVTAITREESIYGTEVKSLRRKNRERRRYSMNEMREYRNHRRK